MTLKDELKEMFEQLRKMIEESQNIVFFGGAGVSTESGIPDFRSEEGLYSAQIKYGYSPEEILSHNFFKTKTEMFYEYYRSNLIYPEVKPNSAHLALANLEKMGKVKAVITQNIDGLHQKAGSKNVLELHGSVLRNYCMQCGEFYELDYLVEAWQKNEKGQEKNYVPKCKKCDGIIKPDVVLYGEPLSDDTIEKSIQALEKADMLVVAGTSLVVYPAAGLINYYSGDKLVLINKSKTSYDHKANLVINEKVGEVLMPYSFTF